MKTRKEVMERLEMPDQYVDEDKKCWMVKELQIELLLDIRGLLCSFLLQADEMKNSLDEESKEELRKAL